LPGDQLLKRLSRETFEVITLLCPFRDDTISLSTIS